MNEENHVPETSVAPQMKKEQSREPESSDEQEKLPANSLVDTFFDQQQITLNKKKEGKQK